MPDLATSSRFEVFVGREREFAQLRDALDEGAEKRGRLFLISGEPGIGKTRLADQLAGAAKDRNLRVLWGRCWEGDGAPAYWPWIQVIRALVASLDADGRHQLLESERAVPIVDTIAQIVPELFASRSARPTVARPAPSQFVLFDSVATLMREAARLGPMVILLDDLHDADVASLTMLQFVARELWTTGVLLIGTYREAEMQRSPALSAQIGELAREARSLPLAGLSSEEIADFFHQVVGRTPDADLTLQLHEATAGNPLFVDGIVRGLIAQPGRHESHDMFNIPHSVREAIARRLAKLSEPTQAALQVAAAIGNEFDAAICGRVKEVSQEQVNSWLDEGARDGIAIALGQGRYRFAHALIRASIYDALDTNTRGRLHGAIGCAMEEQYAQNIDAHLDELAHHFREAGIKGKAIDYSHRAGRAAFAVFAYAVAAAHWSVASALTVGQRDKRRAEILYWLGRMEAFFLDPSRGIAHLEESLRLYQELGEEAWAARLNVTVGLANVFLVDFAPEMNVARSLEYFRQAQEWKGEWDDPTMEAWLHRGISVALFQRVRIEEALASARRAYQIWRELADPQWLDAGAWIAQLLSIQGRRREAAAMQQEVLLALQGVRDPAVVYAAIWSIGWAHMVMLNPAEARRCFTTIVQDERMSAHQRSGGFEFLFQTEVLAGNVARARELAAAHRANPEFRAGLARAEGDFEAAAEMARTMIEWGRRTGHLWDVVVTLPALAASLNLAGDPKQGLELLDEAMQLYEPSNFWLETGVRPSAASLEIILGRPERAEAHLQVARAILAKGEDWTGRAGLTYLAEGRLAAAVGRPFTEHFEKAIATFKRYCLPVEEANTLMSWGTALLGEGNRAEADAKFDAAIEIYRRCGAGQRWIDRVEAARNKPLPAPSQDRKPSSTFQRDGDFWTIAHDSKTSRVRNVKGLAYIAHLLGRPGERVHVIDLVQAIEGGADTPREDSTARTQGLAVQRGLGDAGNIIDAQALDEYRRRQSELRSELEAAQRDNDPGRIEAAQHEFEMISDALTDALGRGGRTRRKFSHKERARSLVTKHIRSAIDLIRRNDPPLATHLDRCIHTGSHCAYLPESREKIDWQI